MAALTKITIWNIHFALSNERDSVNRTFPFAKRDISEWGSKYEPKNNSLGVVLIRFVSNPCVCQAPKSSCLIAAHGTGAHEALFIF